MSAASAMPARRTGPRSAMLVLMVGSLSLCAQTADPKISSAPGGVPVPPVPSRRAAATVDSSPLSRVFRVRVVDGRNGSSVDRAHLQLWYDEQGGTAFALTTNAQGVALLPAPVGTPVRILVRPEDKIDCRRTQANDNPANPSEGYNLLRLAESGFSSANHCGQIGAIPKPGELVLFVRPLRWYEGLNRQ